MKKIIAIFFIISGIHSCKSPSSGSLDFSGQIKGLPAGSEIVLQEITFSNRNSLDTAAVDAQGDFSFHTNIKTLGLYQLMINGKGGLFLVLDEKPTKLVLRTDSIASANYNYKVEGSPATEQLRKFILEMKTYGEIYGAAMKDYETMINDSSADSIKNIYVSKVEMADSNFRIFLNGYVDSVKNPIIAMFAATNLDMKNDWGTIDKLTQRIKNEYSSLPFSQAFLSVIDEQRQKKQEDYYGQKFENGTALPEIVMEDFKGKTIKLSSLRGKIVLLDFWASWCGPCRKENPNVVAAYKKFHDKGFTVFSVSLDNDKSKWLAAIKNDGLVWNNHVSELKGWNSQICQTFGIRAIPQSYLLDTEGKVVAYNLRGEALINQIDQLMK